MANFIDVKLLGSKKLQKKLNAMDARVAGKMLKGVMKEAMEPVKQLAARRAPVRTGKLRKSIRTAIWSDRNAVGAVVRTGTRRQLGIDPTDKYYYPSAIEYGTSKLRAKPFMRSALADRQQQVLNEVRLGLKRAIEKA